MTPTNSFFLMWILILLALFFTIFIPWALAEDHITIIFYVIDGDGYRQVPVHFGTQEFVYSNCKEGAQGCWHDPRIWEVEEIFVILEQAGYYPNYGGCNVVWHELSHAMGYDHEWMFRNLPNHECSYDYINKRNLDYMMNDRIAPKLVLN